VTKWDITATSQLLLGAWAKIPFNNEVLRVQGARITSGGWYHKLVKGDEGVWWYYAHIAINIPIAANCSRAKLAIFHNDQLYQVVDQLDAGYAGEVPIRDVILRGGTHVNLKRGDTLDVRLWTTITGPPSMQTFAYASSIGGYVTGHRVKCNQRIESYQGGLDGYVFV
jgi:hypothetical protein